MEMDDFHDEKDFIEKEFKRLKKEILDEDENGEPRHSGSRWTKLIKTKI